MAIPSTQQAVQLTGPDTLELNTSKEVFQPGPEQILARVEVVGLCFSDLKLLKQFSSHPRKSDIITGLTAETLTEIPSYVPNQKPTVPGHEVCVIIEQVGSEVTDIKPGERYLVQTDYRWLKTEASNAAFGYNFEGALQEYVLLDHRVITSPDGDSTLIPASTEKSASAIALVEPWACVEDSYVVVERRTLKENGTCLIAATTDVPQEELAAFLAAQPAPATLHAAGCDIENAESIDFAALKDEIYDDIIYFGADKDIIEQLFHKLIGGGIINICLCGGKFTGEITTPVGRVHYGGIRITGTTGRNPADGMNVIPATGEIRRGDIVDVVGAGGPMGTMHVIRNVCQGVENVEVRAGDLSADRLAHLAHIVTPIAEQNGVGFSTYNPKESAAEKAPTFIAMMVPSPALVAASVNSCGERGIINIFAGIPATVYHPINLQAYIEKQLYFIGTSGSTIEDMKTVLDKVQSDRLDTNLSAAAVCGLEGAIDGIRAVENQAIGGKILVYPGCRGLQLTELNELEEKHPAVAEKLNNGLWTKEAEQALLAEYRA